MKADYRFYSKEKIDRGDLILIPFGEKVPSTYRVLHANKRRQERRAVVLEDTYEKEPRAPGTVVDLGKAIYDGYWCFRVVKPARATRSKTVREKP